MIKDVKTDEAKALAEAAKDIKKKLDESDEELLELAIIELRDRFHLLSKEIIVPFPEFEFEIELQVLSNEDPKLKIIPLFQYRWDNEKLNYNNRNQPILPSGIYRLLIFDDLSQPYFSNEFVLK